MKVIASLLILPVAVVLRGIVLKAFWGWFVLPVFSALPTLGLMQAVGLSAAVSVFAGAGSDSMRLKSIAEAVGAKEQETLEAIIYAIAVPLFTLALGWVLHLFI